VIDGHLRGQTLKMQRNSCDTAAMPYVYLRPPLNPQNRKTVLKGKKKMASYLVQASYTSEAFAALVKKPQDRASVVRAAAKKLGGSVSGLWGSFGEQDIVIILEMPDTVSAAAMMMAVNASGALKSSKITPLYSTEEGMAAAKKAQGSGYKPPTKKK
jgi:uncharacterized protein with GYD domain